MEIDGKKVKLKKLRGRKRKDGKIIMSPTQIAFLKKFGMVKTGGWFMYLEEKKDE